ncbi:hypothetical protein Vi05172_g6503 [Venturia inaequalis]|nr:hypothetical protein Vi05172_g6503 [Venturia inaequalis]
MYHILTPDRASWIRSVHHASWGEAAKQQRSAPQAQNSQPHASSAPDLNGSDDQRPMVPKQEKKKKKSHCASQAS